MLTGKKKLLVLSVLTAITSVDFVCNANAEELKSYKLSEIIVEGRIDPNSTYDGQIIRTGGDVTVITSQEIEKKHYTSVADAIKRLPGVDVQTVGYKAFEYDYGDYQDEVRYLSMVIGELYFSLTENVLQMKPIVLQTITIVSLKCLP